MFRFSLNLPLQGLAFMVLSYTGLHPVLMLYPFQGFSVIELLLKRDLYINELHFVI